MVFGLGVPSVQKDHLAKKHCGIPLISGQNRPKTGSPAPGTGSTIEQPKVCTNAFLSGAGREGESDGWGGDSQSGRRRTYEYELPREPDPLNTIGFEGFRGSGGPPGQSIFRCSAAPEGFLGKTLAWKDLRSGWPRAQNQISSDRNFVLAVLRAKI